MTDQGPLGQALNSLQTRQVIQDELEFKWSLIPLYSLELETVGFH